jgi:hypothetical protein
VYTPISMNVNRIAEAALVGQLLTDLRADRLPRAAASLPDRPSCSVVGHCPADRVDVLIRLRQQTHRDRAVIAEVLHLRMVNLPSSVARVFSEVRLCGYWNSSTTPPVKSMPRFRPCQNSSTTEAMSATLDTPYHMRRVCMKGYVVTLWKNSMVRFRLDD